MEPCSPERLSFPSPFFRIIANQKRAVGEARGTVHSSNHWQLSDLHKKQLEQAVANAGETVSLILGGGHRQCHPGRGFVLTEYDIPLATKGCYHETAQTKHLFTGLFV